MHVLRLLLVTLAVQPALAQEPRRISPSELGNSKPVYREPKKGETRVEGLLRRVECPSGRPVTFVLQVKDQPEKYEAARLGDVEYLAHTPDFKGPMTCGGRGAGDRVLLTWKTTGKTRTVVAIEFLPKE
jgi:hypothetical protein